MKKYNQLKSISDPEKKWEFASSIITALKRAVMLSPVLHSDIDWDNEKEYWYDELEKLINSLEEEK